MTVNPRAAAGAFSCHKILHGFQMTLARALVTGLLAALVSPPAGSRTVLGLDAQRQPVLLQDWGDYWLDPSGQSSPQHVSAATRIGWQPTQRQIIYRSATGQALWIRFSVPPAPDTERWYLEVPAPSIKRVTLYTLQGSGQWAEQKAGDLVAVSHWPVPHRHPLMPMTLSAEVPTSYLLRFENDHAFSAPLQFVGERYLSHSEQRISLVLGIFFGLVGLATLVSALSAVALRDPAYGFYAVSVALMGLTQAAVTGVAGLHLWPDWPWWNDVSSSVLPMLELAATLMFISATITLSERSLRLHRTLTAVALLGVAVAVAVAVVPAEQRMDLFMLYVLLSQLLAGYALVWAWRRGDRFAPWVMLGMLPVVVASADIMARKAGLIPIDFMTQHGTQMGVAVELPVLMVMLMLRSQQRRENTRRFQGLDRLDPATGLINGHVFAERLMRMLGRSKRLKHQSVVMLIDIMNIDRTRRDFGRKAADELPLRVAERLLFTARAIDSTARLSERRFGMLAEGPFSAEEAAILGPRIVARCLMPYQGLHANCVAQVRVAYAVVPHADLDGGQDLLSRLEERLVVAGTDDRKAVFMLSDTADIPMQWG